jgi:biopolymer transport protein ExbD
LPRNVEPHRVNFRPRRHREDPEINLIAFIDVLLVILIFVLLSTTYSRFTELALNLPAADAQPESAFPKTVTVAISAEGRFSLNGQATDGRDVALLTQALTQAAAGRADTVVLIAADALAPHQWVVNALDAARRAGLPRVTFSAQRPTTP